MPKGYVYILECNDGTFYTGSTTNLEERLHQHQDGRGANHTKKRLPITLVYLEEFQRIDDAFYREKQIQGWSRKKKEALINDNQHKLPKLSLAYRDNEASRASASKPRKEFKSKSTSYKKDTEIDNRTSKASRASASKKNNSSVSEALEDTTTFYSNGKLLLTGEYLVLDGAKSLALPTKYGQHLTIEPNDSNAIHWKSIDHNEHIWFETNIKLNNLSSDDSNTDFEKRLIQILKAVNQLNPHFLNTGYSVETKLTFPKDWGLGSSSTLINNLANWAQIDPYELLKLTFSGSGYDIACASNNSPIVYSLKNDSQYIQKVDFNPNFKDNLYFVYLNKKQNSRDAIEAYRKNIFDKPEAISSVNKITESIINCNNLSEFNDLVAQHETIMGSILKQQPIKNRLFSDFQGATKSLGAWGGDFILATATENPSAYFKAKGFVTVISYSEMII